MPICERGDIAVVAFPFTDMPVTKRRPALVLSTQQFNTENGHTVFAMITSAHHSSWPTDIAVAADEKTGLSHPSVIRWKLFTLSNDIILGKAGAVDETTLSSTNARLETILGLALPKNH